MCGDADETEAREETTAPPVAREINGFKAVREETVMGCFG